MRGHGVDRLRAHAIEAHGELKDLCVVLGPGVDGRDAVHNLAQRDAAAKVTHRDHTLVADMNIDPFPRTHDIFINSVIHYLLEEDIDTVVGMSAVAKTTNIHSWPLTDMLKRT